MKIGPLLLRECWLAMDAEASIESIEPAASQLFFMQRNINWWIGDLIKFGEARFGDDAWQFVPESVTESYIGRVAAHSTKYRPTDRVPGASWTMHSMVARHRPELRRELLERAAEERMDTAQFKQFIGDFFHWKDLP